MARALEAAGWPTPVRFGRESDPKRIGIDADLVLIATPDQTIARVADTIPHRDEVVVAHMAGSLGLGVLGAHPRTAAVHPLVSLPNEEAGAQRLLGAWFAVAGDVLIEEVVTALRGRSFEVADEARARYHAAAVVASNHLVALLGQAERIATSADVPFAALLDLVDGTVANVREFGPAEALTGPAARGDEETIRRHLNALPEEERRAYEALSDEARRLAAGRTGPSTDRGS